MFETAELGLKVGKQEFDERETTLRTQLLMTQQALKEADFPVIILFGGVDGAGKSETAQILNEWMDPRWIGTRAFGKKQQEEEERPRFWRYWRALPRAGRIGILLSAWYSKPILDHVNGGKDRRLESDLEEIQGFERMLANHGALILKFWMHLGKSAQKRRFKKLEKDPLQSWRVTELDWKHYEQYEDFVATAETVISRTSTGRAPWFIVEGADPRYRSLRVGELILGAIQERLQSNPEPEGESAARPASITTPRWSWTVITAASASIARCTSPTIPASTKSSISPPATRMPSRASSRSTPRWAGSACWCAGISGIPRPPA